MNKLVFFIFLLVAPLTVGAVEDYVGTEFLSEYDTVTPLEDEPELEDLWRNCVKPESMPVDVLSTMVELVTSPDTGMCQLEKKSDQQPSDETIPSDPTSPDELGRPVPATS